MNKYKIKFNEYTLEDYYKSLIGKVFKLLPMFEENDITIKQYFDNFMVELAGANELFMKRKEFIELIVNLEGLMLVDSHKQFRSIILKCTGIINKLLNEKEG